MAMKRAFYIPVGEDQEYYTHPDLVNSLGKFDIDPCTGIHRPWSHAPINWTIEDDGLTKDWQNKRIWGNFPFDRYVVTGWYKKMSQNNNGIALQIGKSDTKWFAEYVKPVATSMLLMEGRIYFYSRAGNRHDANCGGAPILVMYGEENADAAEDSGIKGAHVPLNMRCSFGVNLDGTWLDIVRIATSGMDTVTFKELYPYIQGRWPDKCARNPFWKEQIRKCYYYLKQEKKTA